MTWWQIVLGGLGVLLILGVGILIGAVVSSLVLVAAFNLHDWLQKLAKNKGGR